MKISKLIENELKACFDKFGIVAGRINYNDYWTRDAYYGWLAALELNNTEIVKNHLIMLGEYQKSNGLIPFIIRQFFPALTYLKIKIPVKPIPYFKSHKALFTSEVIDSNAFYILGIHAYYQKTKDEEFLKNNLEKLKLAANWYLGKLLKNNLISEGYIAQWNDGIYKHGTTLITNIEVAVALEKAAELLDALKIPNTIYKNASESIKSSVIANFWNKTYLIDWIYKSKKYNYFDTIANLLAIIWNLADKSMADTILSKIEQEAYIQPFIRTSVPNYETNLVDKVNRLLGMGMYWQGINVFWTEPVLLYIWALHATGANEKAQRRYNEITDFFEKHNGLYETYVLNKGYFKPLNKLIYKAEHPFARGSGMYVFVGNLLNQGQKVAT